jgi:ring-1,2-phenylacetyl-CoA epoxidase subunit PaaD
MVSKEELLTLLDAVKDPEIPVLSIRDLGILRAVTLSADGWVIDITPTYSGCPAMITIEEEIVKVLKANGITQFTINSSLSPAWTTDWITEEGKRKLEAYGIAPPVDEVDKSVLFSKPPVVPCPKCKETNTKLISQFGSTACKAHYQCQVCLEPFDYFKCLR